MTPGALQTAARLMEAGANLPELYFTSLVQRTFEAARYWGEGLAKLQREGRLVWTELSLEDRKTAGYSGGDDADLVNMLTSIEDTDVAVIFVEQVRGKIKISWRARPGYDVAALALTFGGGGHKAASGAEVEGSLAEVREKVLEATRQLVKTEVVN
jgi:phosphoesterase RecJ-like protein